MNKTYILNRDSDYIDELYHKYSRDIARYCSLYCKSQDDVSDCIQEIFIIALEKIKKDIIVNPQGWLFKIAKNVIFNTNRKYQKRIKLIKNIDDYNNLIKDTYNEDHEFSTYDYFEDDLITKTESLNEYNKLIEHIQSKLTEKQWIKFNERYIQNLSPTEIFKKYKRNYSSITTELNKLKNILIKILEKYYK